MEHTQPSAPDFDLEQWKIDRNERENARRRRERVRLTINAKIVNNSSEQVFSNEFFDEMAEAVDRNPEWIEDFTGVILQKHKISKPDLSRRFADARKRLADIDAQMEPDFEELQAQDAERKMLASASERDAAIIAEVNGVVESGDIGAAYALIPRLALLELPVWVRCRAKLHAKFGAELALRTFDKLVKEQRPADTAAPRITSPAVTGADWTMFLDALQARYQGGWFTARDVATWLRESPMPALFQHIDPVKPQALERSIGRALNSKRLLEHIGALRLLYRIDAARNTFMWRFDAGMATAGATAPVAASDSSAPTTDATTTDAPADAPEKIIENNC